jgi:hypothetical protein
MSMVLAPQLPNVTFRSNFEPIGTVIERLAAQTKIPMLATGELKNYPIYVSVKDVPFQNLMDKVAEVSGGEWEKKDGSYYLSATQSLRTIQERQGDLAIINAVEATINAPIPVKKTAQDLEALAKQGEKNQEKMMEMVSEMFGSMFNADEATLKLIRSIGAASISTIVDGRRVVLSNRPNSMQALMPSKAINEITAQLKAMAKEKLAADAAKAKANAGKPKAKPGEDEEEDMAAAFSIGDIFGGGGTLKNPNLVNQLGVIQASFQIVSRKTLSVNLEVFAQSGESVYSKMVQMPILNPEERQAKVEGKTEIAINNGARAYAKALMDGEEIDPMMKMLTNTTGGFAMMFGGMGGGPAAPAFVPSLVSDEIRNAMMSPLQNEPLSGLFGPILDIEAQSKNVVALPSDDVFRTLTRSLIAGRVTLEGVLNEVDRSVSQVVTRDGTWTTVKASSPLELRSAHCNRSALSNLIKRAATKGYANLDDCADFATKQGSARGSEALALPLLTAIFRTSDLGSASALTSTGFDGLKLYASLSDFQKQALKKKQSVALASFTLPQKEILGRMIYNGLMPPFKANSEMSTGIDNFEKMDQGQKDGDEGDPMGGMGAIGMQLAGPMLSMLGMGENSFDNERTNLLPSGVPVVGSVKASSVESTGLMATNTANQTNTITVPEMLGLMESDVPFMKMAKRDYDTYRLAKQKTLFLVFKLGNQAVYFTTLYDVEVDNSRSYTKEQLPEKIRNRMKPISMGDESKATKPIDP